MSESLFIGLSREQVEALLKGERVGKRPYNISEADSSGKVRYRSAYQIFVKMLTDNERKKEPDTAFGW